MAYPNRWDRAIPHSYDLYTKLGLNPNRHLPDEGLPLQEINGVQVYIKPKHEMVANRRKHRVMAICPGCSKHVPAGRLFQHICGSKP